MSPNPVRAAHSSAGRGSDADTGRELVAFFVACVSSCLSYFYFQELFSSSHVGDVLNTDEAQYTRSY